MSDYTTTTKQVKMTINQKSLFFFKKKKDK